MHLKIALVRIFLFLFLVAGITACVDVSDSRAAIRTVTGTITKIVDGDTVHLITPEQTKLKVRLYGIDTPEAYKISRQKGQINEIGQPYAEESKKALNNKVMGKQVQLDIITTDKYRRIVGIIWLGERNINLEMVREGYAEAFLEYLDEPYRAKFIEAEHEAKTAKKGIWSFHEYERPRDFRKRLKMGGVD